MHLKEISPEKTPELFYCEDPLNVGTFDQDNLEDTSVSNGKGLIQRAKSKDDLPVDQMANARIEEITGKKHFFVDLYYDSDLVCTWELIPEYWDGNSWEFQEVDGTVTIEDGKMVCSGIQGGFSWDVEINFSRLNSKWHWNVTAPGFTVRAVWQIVFTSLGQQLMADGDLKLDLSDYDGNISDDEGVTTRRIIFEEAGIDASSGWLLDPYLSVNEPTNQTVISMDGGIFHFYETSEYYIARFYKKDGSTKLLEVHPQVKYDPGGGENTYTIGAAAKNGDGVYTILENTPTRVIVEYSGDIKELVGNTFSTDASVTSAIKMTFTIYPEKIYIRFHWTVSSSITLTANRLFDNFAVVEGTNCVNELSIYETGGSEVITPNLVVAGDYAGFVCDQINVIASMIDNSVTGTDTIVFKSDSVTGQCGFYIKNMGGTFTDIDHTIAISIDTAERETRATVDDATWTVGESYITGDVVTYNSVNYEAVQNSTGEQPDTQTTYWRQIHLYTITKRLAMGNDNEDETLDQSPTDGDDVVDMVIPARIDTGTLHSDGAHHYTAENLAAGVTDITLDRTRIRPSFVIADPVFHTGSVAAPTDLLVAHFKIDETTAITTLDNAEGTAGRDGSLAGGNTCDNLDSTDAVRGTSLLLDGTDDYLNLNNAISALADDDKFTIIVRFKPNFAYDYAGYPGCILVGSGAEDRIVIYYRSNDDTYRFQNDVANASVIEADFVSPVYTENNSLQQYHTLVLGVDLSQDLAFTKYDNLLRNFSISESWAATVDELYIGVENNTPGNWSAMYIDEIRVLDGCILPYGAYHIGNGSGLLADIDNPHKNLSWFFDGQAALAKGGTDLGDTDNPTNTGGQFIATDAILGTNCWDSNGTDNVLTVADIAEDIVDYNKGFIALWFNVQTPVSGGEFLVDVRSGDGNDRIYITFDADGNIDIGYKSQTINYALIAGNIVCGAASGWHYLLVKWDDTDELIAYIDGVQNGSSDTIDAVWGGGNGLTWYFTEDYNNANGCDVKIQTITMGKDPNTPEIWTAMAKPLHINLTGIS